MKTKILLLACLAFFSLKNQAQTVTDIDGNIYDTIQIGTQVWFTENLATTRYNDGTAISLITDSSVWCTATTPAYCWYYNDSASYKNPYGALYNWYAVNTNKLCPAGWHVPSNAEWHTLILSLDPAAQDCYCTESSIAGDALKEAGSAHWNIYNTGNNSSGFSALPGGEMNTYFKTFINLHGSSFMWSSTPNGTYSTAWHRLLNASDATVKEYLDDKASGMSVRCVQNNTTTVMNNIDDINTIKIFPNPASRNIFIDCTGRKEAKMQVFNMIGECVSQRELNSGSNDIDISSLSKGIYAIKITGIGWTVQSIFTKE
jgi:uncharacterized protein (TIGR02145 family)